MDAQESQIYIAIIVAVVVIGITVCYFFYSIIRQHKKVLDLERDNAAAQVTLLEKDRERIAVDLHDDLAPMLVAVRMRVNSFDLEKQDDKDCLSQTNNIIDDIAKRMRTISYDLMPATLKDKGLEVCVREFVNHISQRNDLHIRFDPPAQKLKLSEKQTIHTYRIIQEIVHNTIKHAKAKELFISLAKEDGLVVLTSKDDGTGFDLEQQRKDGKGLGLKSLYNRANLMHAEVSVKSGWQKGTGITIKIPVTNDPSIL